MIHKRERAEFNRLCEIGKGKNLVRPTELVIDGRSALECWVHHERYGTYPPCCEPDILDRARNGEKVDFAPEPEPVPVFKYEDVSWIDPYLPNEKVAKEATIWDKCVRIFSWKSKRKAGR